MFKINSAKIIIDDSIYLSALLSHDTSVSESLSHYLHKSPSE